MHMTYEVTLVVYLPDQSEEAVAWWMYHVLGEEREDGAICPVFDVQVRKTP